MGGGGLFGGGTAEFRIGLRPIPEADWLEPGRADPERKAALLAAYPRVVWGELAGSRRGQAEALALVERQLGGTASATHDPPLWAAGLLVAEDLCLMEKREERWTLAAASLCSPSFFTAEHAMAGDLRGLHDPVPGFAERLLARVERIFDALRPGMVLERRNWSLVPSGELFLPDPAPLRAAWEAFDPDEAVDALHLRMERQTLRRLPATGGALFTIRIHRHPLAALAFEPARLSAFERAWAEVMSPAGEPFRRYKGLERFNPAVMAWLAGRRLAGQAQASPGD